MNYERMVIISNIEIIESQLRQMLGQVVWTHKIQEKQSDIYKFWYNVWETTRILTSAITTSGIVASLIYDSYCAKVITAIVSLISLFINSYLKVYDLKNLQRQHKQSALAHFELRERIICTLSDIKLNKIDESQAINLRDELSKKFIEICKITIDPSEEAVKKASKCLKVRQDNTFSDAEIDSYLPVCLRKK